MYLCVYGFSLTFSYPLVISCTLIDKLEFCKSVGCWKAAARYITLYIYSVGMFTAAQNVAAYLFRESKFGALCQKVGTFNRIHPAARTVN